MVLGEGKSISAIPCLSYLHMVNYKQNDRGRPLIGLTSFISTNTEIEALPASMTGLAHLHHKQVPKSKKMSTVAF